MILSIVMIVYNKSRELPFTLAAFRKQEDAGFPWELIIIDDGSTDGSVDLIHRIGAGLPISVHGGPHTGNRNFLRNKGASLVSGRRIAFLDGDIIPSPTYLHEHGMSTPEEVLLGRRINTRKFPDEPGLLLNLEKDAHFLETLPQGEDERSAHFFLAPLAEQPHPWRFLHSHNVSIPAQAFRKVGGFCPDLKNWGADDLELGFRLYREGLRFRYSAKAGGTHLHHPNSMNPEGYHRNLEIFLSMHPFPEVELLFIEYLLKPRQALQAFRACGRQSFHVQVDPAHAMELSGERLLLNHVKGLPGVPVPGLGLSGNLGEGFDVYVISPELSRLGPKVVLEIIEKGWQVAAEVVVYDPNGEATERLAPLEVWHSGMVFQRRRHFLTFRKGAHKKRHVLFFQRENLLDITMLDQYRVGLVASLRQRKNVLLITQEAKESSDIAGNFLSPEEDGGGDELPEILDEPVFVFPRPWMPDFGSSIKKRYRIYYENLPSPMKGPRYYQWLESSYDLVLHPCEMEKEEFLKSSKGAVPTRVLPPCFDPSIFHPVPRGRNGKFRILFVSKYPTYTSGFEHLMEAYLGEFRKDEDVILTVVLSKPQHLSFRDPYLNSEHNDRLSRWSNRGEAILNHPIDHYLQTLARKHPEAGDFEILREDLTHDRFAERLRQADLMVEPSLLSRVPLASLPALACGTQVILPSHLLPYFEELAGGVTTIPSIYSSAHVLEYESINSVDPETPVSQLHRSMFRIRTDDLAKALRKKFEEWKQPGSGARVRFEEIARNKYGADRVADQLMKILEEVFGTRS